MTTQRMGAAGRSMAAMIAIALIVLAASVSASTDPATLASARIGHHGKALELHFGFSGPVPRMSLIPHGRELWIDLPNTEARLPPRPLYGQEVAPVKTLRITGDGVAH